MEANKARNIDFSLSELWSCTSEMSQIFNIDVEI